MTHFKLNTEQRDESSVKRLICQEFQRLFSLDIDFTANFNKNRAGYALTTLSLAFDRTPDRQKYNFVERILGFFYETVSRTSGLTGAEISAQFRELVGPYRGGVSIPRTLRKYVSSFEIYLAQRQLITLYENYTPNFARDEAYYSTTFFSSMPEVFRFHCLTAGPAEAERKRLTNEESVWVSDYHQLIDGWAERRAQGISACWRRLFIFKGISTFDQITKEAYTSFREEDPSNSDRNYNEVAPLLIKYGARLKLDDVRYYTSPSRKMRHSLASQQPKTIKRMNGLSNLLKELADSSERLKTHHILSSKDARKLTGLSGIVVTTSLWKKHSAIIDGYQAAANISDFSTSSLLENNEANIWLLTQNSFLESSAYEASTRKNYKKHFGILNEYIFGYLKYFFETANKFRVPYRYPKTIADFHGAIYVKNDDILARSMFKASPSEIDWPLTLPDFIKERCSGQSKNTIKSVIRNLQKYFEFIVISYQHIDECKLATNPLSKIYNYGIRGTAYNTTQKTVMELEYWMLFKEYLYEVANSLVSMIENKQNVPREGDVTVDINKSITFDKFNLTISEVTFYNPKYNTSDRRMWAKPQHLLALLVMAHSGMRLASALWLDRRLYSSQYNDETAKDAHELVPLFVSTDKVKETEWISHISKRIMDLLIRYDAVRDLCNDLPMNPIPYQGEEGGKWPDIYPLLSGNKKNNDISHTEILNGLVIDFERKLRENNIELKRHSLYKPKYISTTQHLKNKAHKRKTKADTYCIHYPGQGDAYFTPIELSTAITPHSLRATIDTWLPLLVGGEAVGGLLTGQTPATVSYYAKVNPERALKMAEHKNSIAKSTGLDNLVTAFDVAKDEEAVVSAIRKSGIGGLNGFVFSIQTDRENVEINLDRIDPSDISIHATHICIYGDECPDDILESIKEKNCALCPVAIGTVTDLPGIAAKIRYHAENIAQINEELSNNYLSKAESGSLKKRRLSELKQASSWFVRLNWIEKSATNKDDLITFSDGIGRVQEKVSKVDVSQGFEAVYARLKETRGTPSLQSEKLRIQADRISRKLTRVSGEDLSSVEKIGCVEKAAALIDKIASINGLTMDDVQLILESKEDSYSATYIKHDMRKKLIS